MDIREFAQQVRALAQEALLHIDPAHGHAERLAQTTSALEAIDKLASEHAPTPEQTGADAPAHEENA